MFIAKPEVILKNGLMQKTDIVLGYSKIPANISAGYEYLINLISPDERAQLLDIRNKQRQKSFLWGRALLRKVLNEVAGNECKNRQWYLHTDSYGKPRLQLAEGDCQEISFSISHTHGLVCVAASSQFHVGLDVELIPNENIDIDAALAPEEQDYLETFKGHARTKKTITIWTIKEAYSKLLGKGLSMDFQALVVDLEKNILNSRFLEGLKPIETVNFLYEYFELEGLSYVLTVCFTLQVQGVNADFWGCSPLENNGPKPQANFEGLIKKREFFLL
ncbi:MAG: 4'-phosphopantetheinyl transferase superfamily protein [Thermodesulfobacteria bacterium]|nr:4'-phosphopantetheinyl transferase superfamily protein [Thermodesulfobacteriota bacterium]